MKIRIISEIELARPAPLGRGDMPRARRPAEHFSCEESPYVVAGRCKIAENADGSHKKGLSPVNGAPRATSGLQAGRWDKSAKYRGGAFTRN